MNRTITLPELAEAIASATDIPRAESESFLKDLFSLIGERLADNDDVTIKGLGRFAAVEGTPAFYPDSEFADGVNQPFAAFEAIELDPAITPDMLDDAVTGATAEKPEEPEDPQEASEAPEEPAEETPTEAEEPAIDQPEPIEDIEEAAEPEALKEKEDTAETEEYDEPEPQPYRMPSWKLLLLILLFIFWGAGCFLAGYLLAPGTNSHVADSDDETTGLITIETAEADDIDSISESAIEVETEAAPEPMPVPAPQPVVTDTVRRDRFLTTMAREHYGLMEFWVYIYEENAGRLGDPNRIAPGTTVVIPPAEKYGIDRRNPESVQAAKLKATEIYAPYQK